MTRRIMATPSAPLTCDFRPSRSIARAACSNLPLRTNHHGDSGARNMRTANGVGNIHCSAVGILEFGWVVSIPIGAKRGQTLSSLPGGTAAVLLIHVGNTADDDSSNRPEKLQHLCGRGSEPHRYDLTAVGRSVGNLFESRSISLFPRVSSCFARLTKIPHGIPSAI